jgi:hypothetical protein
MIVVVAATSSDATEAAKALGLVGWVEPGDDELRRWFVTEVVYVEGWRESDRPVAHLLDLLALPNPYLGAIEVRRDHGPGEGRRVQRAQQMLDFERQHRANRRAARSRMGISPEALLAAAPPTRGRRR